MLITATPDNGGTYAEVAHEAVFRVEKLRKWFAAFARVDGADALQNRRGFDVGDGHNR